MAAELTRLTK